jgi:hypothetical protein
LKSRRLVATLQQGSANSYSPISAQAAVDAYHLGRAMSLLVILLILLILFGGGGFYAGGPRAGIGLGGLILIIIVIMALTGRL